MLIEFIKKMVIKLFKKNKKKKFIKFLKKKTKKKVY